MQMLVSSMYCNIERFTLLRARLLAFAHEVLRRARSIYEKLVPAPTDRGNEPAMAELDDLDLMHSVRERHGFWQAYGLASIGNENGRTRHLEPRISIGDIHDPCLDTNQACTLQGSCCATLVRMSDKPAR